MSAPFQVCTCTCLHAIQTEAHAFVIFFSASLVFTWRTATPLVGVVPLSPISRAHTHVHLHPVCCTNFVHVRTDELVQHHWWWHGRLRNLVLLPNNVDLATRWQLEGQATVPEVRRQISDQRNCVRLQTILHGLQVFLSVHITKENSPLTSAIYTVSWRSPLDVARTHEQPRMRTTHIMNDLEVSETPMARCSSLGYPWQSIVEWLSVACRARAPSTHHTSRSTRSTHFVCVTKPTAPHTPQRTDSTFRKQLMTEQINTISKLDTRSHGVMMWSTYVTTSCCAPSHSHAQRIQIV